MKILEKNLYEECNFGDKRLTQRAAFIGELLSVKYGQPLSKIFKTASDLKRGYEFFSNPKTNFEKLTQPYFKQTAQEINGAPVVLAVGDTTFLDYKKILDKREEYGPIGNGGNGLILHSCLAIEPDFGQPLGLLWEKLWHREHKASQPINESQEAKKERLKKERKAKRNKEFKEKESYRWVEAFSKIEKQFSTLEIPLGGLSSKIIHVFDREGDIAEVFAQISQTKNAGVIVRAAHNRCLEGENEHLWSYVTSTAVKFVKDVGLAETKKRNARTATLEVRYCPVSISSPTRLKNQGSFHVYAVYAREINCPENCEPVEWMLLTTESVDSEQSAAQILRWYTYRWRVEEYHKILKSGCKAESYRLAGESMSTMLGFLTVIAAQLLRMTYLHRNCPHLDASVVLTQVQMDVLLASSPPKFKKDIEFTVDWAIRAIARLGGYLEHRKNSAIGIQVLWRGWLELETLCQGWLLHQNLK
ncbi:IS4 family transposase [Halotia branconii]|uniref:IS4 family transposase n=1 Tax=Halotia branconii CENA392 TaxID=1539056 RepID=A0AAJ6NNZ1_9CYAN|nr:IS4 family transposase [Halotia branconii]WGV24043.1 IS4 family transposase [Halotia branconii CENA392]WGV28022.1 IS4 family transposase [Halotia branconii CENA392]WGV29046.1 IS4 family transposase [Halotia branconii CENA392]